VPGKKATFTKEEQKKKNSMQKRFKRRGTKIIEKRVSFNRGEKPNTPEGGQKDIRRFSGDSMSGGDRPETRKRWNSSGNVEAPASGKEDQTKKKGEKVHN